MSDRTVARPSADVEVIRVLGNSLYPGAKPESIALVLSYCRVNGLDVFLKPVHIVPMNVKIGRGKYEWRDVVMPGIDNYRIKAARSGEYLGISEPTFGPDIDLEGVAGIVPEWCKVTVKRLIASREASFTAIEYWEENYATAGRNTRDPTAMWNRRRKGQLAKCTEAQALRKAFPEFTGGQPTAEEMDGKTIENDYAKVESREEAIQHMQNDKLQRWVNPPKVMEVTKDNDVDLRPGKFPEGWDKLGRNLREGAEHHDDGLSDVLHKELVKQEAALDEQLGELDKAHADEPLSGERYLYDIIMKDMNESDVSTHELFLAWSRKPHIRTNMQTLRQHNQALFDSVL